MTWRDEPPFRADEVGSLLRPKALHEARAKAAAGEITAEQLTEAENAAIDDVIRLQQEVGLQTVTDGELRRTFWHMDFIHKLGGITQVADHKVQVHFQNESGDMDFESAGLWVDEPISLTHTIFADAFTYLKDRAATLAPGLTPKLTIPSPSMVHARGGNALINREIYPTDDQFWADLTGAYRQEIANLAELGCTYLQLDDTSLAYLNDPAHRELVKADGRDPEHQHEDYIRNLNSALRDRPEGMRVTTHMCRGNFRSAWAAQGGYDFVAEALFNELDVDGFFMEFDDSRSGGFEPLRFVPKGKLVVLGLVTTKRPELESKDELKRRIDEAAKYVDLDQLCLSPQCGFSSTVEGNDLTEEDEKAKLRLVVETAHEVWG